MSVVERVRAAYRRIDRVDRPEIWIDLLPESALLAEASTLDERGPAGLPLFGKLVAVKGNIDVAGLPTTAGCPAYAYKPDADAPVVAALRAAGALVLGTTNLDQFATGLVGTRSPYGAVRNSVDTSLVSGGSSSGSAVAVALGIADLALGTDTAGSGRVPAAFNGIVGLKPTPGLLSTVGVVPACASIDCVSIFARTVSEASLALGCLSSRPLSTRGGAFTIGVPSSLGPLQEGWDSAFSSAVASYASAGASVVTVDIAPFLDAARLLYEGAFVAERYTAVGSFIDEHPSSVDPTVRQIIGSARDIPAHQLFADQARLASLRSAALSVLSDVDALLLPTTTEHPSLAAVAADPLGVNARLGRFTNSTNLFGLSSLAVPAGTVGGLPFGVMLLGKPYDDALLASIASSVPSRLQLVVVGAHLRGQPLNHELTSRGGRFLAAVSTAPSYRLFALDTVPPKPGLVRSASGGASIKAEVWDLPAAGFGTFVSSIPSPLAIGKIHLSDGTFVSGFLCEELATTSAPDITSTGGWLAHLTTP